MQEKTTQEKGKEGTMVRCPVCGAEFKTQEEHDKHHKEAHPNQ
ncbi:MAG: hypothetical protein ACRDGN_02260 [bacterium]